MKWAVGQILTMGDESQVGYVTGDLAISPESPDASKLLVHELTEAVNTLRREAAKQPCNVKGFCCFIRFPEDDADDLDDYFDADEFKWLVSNALEDIKI